MNKNIRRSLKMACVITLLLSSPVLAEERVSLTDAAGHELIIDEDGNLKMTGDCIFSINGNYKGKLMVIEKKDGKDNFGEIENGRYRVKYTEEKDLSFVIVDEDKMLYRPVNGLPETVKIRTAVNESLFPKAEFSYDESEKKTDHMLISGKEPSIKIYPTEGMATFLKVSSKRGAEKIRITDENNEYHFEEGAYTVEVWNEDGFGTRYDAELPFDKFIYKKIIEKENTVGEGLEAVEETDEENPEIKRLTAEIEEDRLLIRGRCEDELSGIEEVRIYIDSEELPVINKDGEYRAEISPEMMGKGKHRILFKVKDKAGNSAEKKIEFETEDDEPPFVRISGFENMGLYSDDVEFRAEASDDDLSGAVCIVERMDAAGKVLSESEYPQGMIRLSEEGNYRVCMEAEDKNGNKAREEKFLTIDKKAPEIADLSNIDKKYLKSLSLRKDLSFLASDMTLSGLALYLNGREYNGEKIDSAGHYVLTVKAKDKAGHSSNAAAEFVIRRKHNSIDTIKK